MKAILSALLLSFFLSATSWAESPDQDFDALVQKRGLKPATCLLFVDAASIEARTQKWRALIQDWWTQNPEHLTAWIIGAAKPPQSVIEESTNQKDCMLVSLIVAAADPSNEMVVHWGDENHDASAMPRIFDRFQTDTRFRRNLIDWITRSDYRDAREQSYIWHRKFVFRGNPFNRVSAHAAKKCKLPEGRTWNPTMSSHRTCWFETLSTEEREVEILGASAAPGISRHHWGTDFDLFSLNPRNFVDGARMNDEYQWLAKHGVHWGYSQAYIGGHQDHGYMEERWHWSYVPIAAALQDHVRANEAHFAAALNAQWDSFESRWGSKHPEDRRFFNFIRENWRPFMFHVNQGFSK